MTISSPEATNITVTRDVDAAFERCTRRRSEQPAVFPPDFCHGHVPLEALHRLYGESWAEGVAFVQHHDDGRVSVAYFDDWFFTIEHSSNEDALPTWLAERLEGRHTVVELHFDLRLAPQTRSSRWIDLECTPEELHRLEQEHLALCRDGARDWRTVAQTNLLSLVALCATFGDWRSLLH